LGKITLVLGFVALSIFILVMGPDELLYFPGLDTSGSATFGQVTISNRLEIWSRAVYALKDFAITGMGIGTFRVIGPLLYPFFYIEPTRDIAHAHNLFFQSGLDFGILGIISITSIWIAISQILIRPVVSGEGKLFLGRMSAHDVVIGLVGGLLGHFMFSLVDAVALGARPGFLLWMALGLCITLYIVLQRKQRIPNPIQL
jgi:putative inorganic carbon (HCO3(-)) transporter